MPSAEELKRIRMLGLLNDETRHRIAPLVRQVDLGPDEVLFEQDDRAESLYMLVRGQIVLNMSASDQVTVTVLRVEPDECFGWSALLGGGYYIASAVSTEKTTLWVVDAADLRVMLYNDHTMGFKIMEYMAREMSRRLDKRTKQLFSLLMDHLDAACGLTEV